MEPTITINGHELTTAQAMTLRVALETFAMSLQEDVCGLDEAGKAMGTLYMARVREIRALMFAR